MRDVPQIIQDVGFDFIWDKRKVWQLDVAVEEMPIEELAWHFDVPFIWSKPDGFFDINPRWVIEQPEKYHLVYTRTLNAQTTYPIDIMFWRGKWLILDGLHRLMKQFIEGKRTVRVRKIPKDAIPKIRKDPAGSVVVTGASRGIGRAISQTFLAAGYSVVGTYKAHKPPFEDQNFIAVRMDQGKPASIAKASQTIAARVSAIDALVNNAGIILDGHDQTVDVDKVRRTLEVDLLGIIGVTNRLLPLLHRGAHIVNMSTNYGANSFPIDDKTSAGYRLTKAALNMYTRILAFDTKEAGIIVSALDPGWVKTEMGWDVADDTYQPDREPEDVANDVMDIVMHVKETGCYWRYGKQREW